MSGFTKYQNVEKSEVASKDDHKKIDKELRKQGKSSVSQLRDDERAKLTSKLDRT